MALIDTIFRVLSKAGGYTTKGSPLTWTELDRNFEILIDELLSLQAAAVASIAPYNPVTVYDPADTNYVSYLGNIYLFIGASPTSGVTPGTNPAVWQLSSIGALSHQQNTDTYLGAGTPYAINNVQLKTLYDNQIISATYSQVAATKALNALRSGYWYYCTDKFIMLKAVTNNSFDEKNCILLARNPDYQNIGGLMLEASTGDKTCVWSASGTPWWTQVLIDFPTSGSRQNKYCIWKGSHYKSLTGTNTATEPDADATNWLVVAKTDPSYIIETESCWVNFATSMSIGRREDKRGNVILQGTNGDINEDFQFGNDKCYLNYSQGELSNYRYQGHSFGNRVEFPHSITVLNSGVATFDDQFGLRNHYNTVEVGEVTVVSNVLDIGHCSYVKVATNAAVINNIEGDKEGIIVQIKPDTGLTFDLGVTNNTKDFTSGGAGGSWTGATFDDGAGDFIHGYLLDGYFNIVAMQHS